MKRKPYSGKRLRRVIILLGITQKECAEEMKMKSRQAVSNIVNGKVEVSEGNAALLAQAYPQVNQDYILYDTGDPIHRESKLNVVNKHDTTAESAKSLSKSERLERMIDHLGFKVSRFSREIGDDKPQRLYNIINSKGDISESLEKQIKEAFPQFNMQWLRTGEGEMILKNQKSTTENNNDSYIGVAKKDASKPPTKRIPVFEDMEMTASNLEVYQDYPEQASTFFEIDILSDSDLFVPVAGDSMRPEYKPGDRVGLRRIRDGIINYGHDYMIVTESNRLFKTIKKAQENDPKEYIRLCSYNDEFECFEIPRNKVIALFIATGDVSRKSQ